MSELHTRVSFHIEKDVALKFRNAVKNSGYTQTFLIKKAMLEIIKSLEKKEHEEMGGLFDEKQSK